MLAEKFINLTKDFSFNPPMNNYSPFVQSSGWNAKEFFAPAYKDETLYPLINLTCDKECFVLSPDTKWKRISSEIFHDYLKDDTILSQRELTFYDNVRKIDSLYEKYSYDLIAESEIEPLLNVVSEIRQIIWKMNALVFFSIYFDKDFCWQEIEKSKIDLSKEDIEEIWDRGVNPICESFDQVQKKEVLGMISAGRTWAQMAEDCQYMFTSYFDTKSLKEVEDNLEQRFGNIPSSDDARNLKVNLELADLDKKKEFNIWFNNLTINQKKIVRYLQTIIRLRDNRKNFFNKGLTIWWRVAEKLFDQAQVPRKLIRFYTFSELIKGLDYLKSVANKLPERKKGFIVLLNYDGTVEMEYSDFAKNKTLLINHFIKSQNQQSNNEIIKGQCGAPGIVKGKARIVLDSNKPGNFQQGDILVAGMTRPEFVPLMQKASAIITDEGGITCHAAIVSRELKIPCIIGTKIATQVLKDGDMIEVDANKGTVRRIS